MDIIQTIESAAHSAVEAVEHPFHTIGERLKAAGEHLAAFFGHPYCAPPLQSALDTLHGVVVDLAQEVAELRVPCPCKPAPTSAGDDDTVRALSATGGIIHAAAGGNFEVVSAGDMEDFRAWQAAKHAASNFAA
jgi:hypothetical protein